MSLYQFLKLQVQSKLRSVALGRDLFAAVILAIVLFIVMIILVLLAVSMQPILKEALKIDNAVGFMNRIVIFFFATEFFYRFFLQKLPATELQHYLHLPVPRWKIIHFLLQKSFLSLFNLVAIILFTPFAFMEIATNYGGISAITWLGTIVCISWSVHWITLLFKAELGDHLLGVGFIFLVYLLIFGAQYFGWHDTGAIIKPFFDMSLESSLPLILSAAFLIVIYLVSHKYYRSHAYVEELNKKQNRFHLNPNIGFLSSFGMAGVMADAEWKLIFRHKKSRTYLYMSVLLLFYGLLFYPDFDIKNESFDLHFTLFIGLIITGVFMFNYGQLSLSWNSANFDFYLIRNEGLEALIKGKYILYVTISSLFFLLSIPYAYYGWEILLFHLAAFIFNIGFSIHLMTIMSFWRPKPMDINKGAMFNYEGVGAAQFIMFIPLMVIPYMIYLPFAVLFNYQSGLILLIIFGLSGALFHKHIIKLLVKKLNNSRHKISASFRQEI